MDIVFFILIFFVGFLIRGFIEKISKETILRDAEFLWFNPTVFQWERIGRNSEVKPHSRVLMGIPVEPSSLDLEKIHEFQINKLKGM